MKSNSIKQTAEDNNGNFKTSPSEMILYVLQFLSHKDLTRCHLLNRFFNDIASNDSLWRELIITDFKNQKIKLEDNETFYSLYKTLFANKDKTPKADNNSLEYTDRSYGCFI